VDPLLPGKIQQRPVFGCPGTAVRIISTDPGHVQATETCTFLYQELFIFSKQEARYPKSLLLKSYSTTVSDQKV
jgi:hypothetical protein